MSQNTNQNALQPFQNIPDSNMSTSIGTPTKNTASALLHELGIPQSELCRATGLGKATINRICRHGQWPTFNADLAAAAIDGYLVKRGLTPNQVQRLHKALHQKLAPVISNTTEAVPVSPVTETEKEDPMLLPKQTLSAEARKRFALPFANPFDGEVTSDAEMFVNGEIRFVRESAWQAAIGGRFCAIVGESGSGKTTMLEDLKDKILKEHKPIVFIEPSVLGMEDSDTRGKSIKSAGIQTAIVMTLNPSEGVAQSDEKRARQVKRMLEESTTAGHSHLLVIEEAHSLPIPTLKHLKRLHERMRLGRRPMLGILLLGHPELEGKLNRFDVREVMQRCEVARLCPLGEDLLAYLTFRAASVGRKLDEFISQDGVAELARRLTISAGANSKQVSLLYPLNVNNWMVAALNTAASFGAPRVDRDIVLAV